MNVDQIILGIDRAERLAKAGKWRRLAAEPLRYVQAQWHHKVSYAKSKVGKAVLTPTIFGKKMQVILPAGMDIYLLGAKGHDSEIRLARLLCRIIKKGDTVLDVGAHFGFFSMLSATLTGNTGELIACEAAPTTFKILKQNLAKIPHAQALNLAVADQEGEMRFTEFPVEYSEYNTLRPGQFDQTKWRDRAIVSEVSVRTTTVDDLAKSKHIRFIKIDVEGAEDLVIKGMTKTIKRENPPLICLEYLTSDRDNSAHLFAIDVLEKAGFQAHEISNNGELLPTSLAHIDDHLTRIEEDSDNIVFKK